MGYFKTQGIEAEEAARICNEVPLAILVAELEDLIQSSMVDDGDTQFASSLVTRFKKDASLSLKQSRWVVRLIDRAVSGDGSTEIEEEAEAPKKSGEYQVILDFFVQAKTHLKYPKLVLKTKHGGMVSLSITGNKSKQPDTISITDGKAYGQNKWYGRINKQGDWDIPDKAVGGLEDVELVLTKFAKNPQKTVSEHGKKTGHCAFCSTQLTDGKSLEVGYGPTCAKH